MLAFGVFLLALFGSRLAISYRTAFNGCARDDGTGGASGLFRWAKRLEIPVRLLEVPIWEAPQSLEQPVGNCIITMGNGRWSLTGEDLQRTDWIRLRDWLAKGNAILIATMAPGKLPKEASDDLVPPAIREIAAQATSPLSPDLVDARPQTSNAPVKQGGHLTVEAEGPRWVSMETKFRQPAAGSASEPRASQQTGLARLQMAGDGRGGVLFRIPIGNGAAYILLDDFAWTNAGFDQPDNARVLATILKRELGQGVLGFDEYRHGHGRAESIVTYLFGLPGAHTFVWLASVWLALYVYGRNVRLQPAEDDLEVERRTAREYIDAVAQLYERARASPLVVETVARRVRHLSRPFAEVPVSLGDALREAESYTKRQERPAHPRNAILLVRELIRLRKQLYGSRSL